MALALFLLGAFQEGIRLPGCGITAEEQIGQTERIVERLGGCVQLGTRVRVLNLDNPGRPHCLDCEPTRTAWLAVLVLHNGAVSDQTTKFGKQVALDRGEVRRTPLRSLLSYLNPFHGKLRRGPDVKPVDGKAPSCPNRPAAKPPMRDVLDD